MEREKHKPAWKQSSEGRDGGYPGVKISNVESEEFPTAQAPRKRSFGLAPDPLTLDSGEVKPVVSL